FRVSALRRFNAALSAVTIVPVPAAATVNPWRKRSVTVSLSFLPSCMARNLISLTRSSGNSRVVFIVPLSWFPSFLSREVIDHARGAPGPFACDWDGDGKTDLLVGAGDGSVWFYRNVGTAKEPNLPAGVRLVSPGNVTYGPDAP